MVKVDATTLSAAKTIIATTVGVLTGSPVTGVINVPSGTSVNKLITGLTLPAGATVQVLAGPAGTPFDNPAATTITSTMVIQITAQDGSTAVYTISLADSESSESTPREPAPVVEERTVSVEIVGGNTETIVSKVSAGKINLEIFTENARIIVPADSLNSITQDLYFRVVPIKDEMLRKQVEARAISDQATLEQAKGRTVNIDDRPSMIETNMPSRSVTIVLPLREKSLPTNVSERNTFLQSLYVYIEHHDGEREILKGSIDKYDSSGQYGIQFGINKFSTFAIIAMSSEITSYRLPGQVSPSKIDPLTGTIDVQTGSGVDLSNLEAYFTLSPGATATVGGINQVSGVTTNDFTKPVKYLVKAGDGTIKEWTVNTSVLNQLTIPAAGHTAYIKGYPDGNFGPDRGITRAEMATILSRLVGGNMTTITSSYPDVGGRHWANQAIEIVTSLGLMKGYPDRTFKPEAIITRAEMATVIARWFKIQGIGEAPYSDVVGSWARENIGGIHRAGIMIGYPDGTFRPEVLLTRAEAVTSINNLLGRGGLFGMTKGTWKDVPVDQWAFHDIEEASRSYHFEARPQGGKQLKS